MKASCKASETDFEQVEKLVSLSTPTKQETANGLKMI